MERARAVDPVATRPGLRERALAVPREKLLFLLGIVAVGLHVVDDNYLQPEPGTSAGDHLTSGLVPLAILAAVTVLYPRIGGGLRAGIAMTFGAIAITIGVPGAYYLLDGSASGDHYTGLLAIVAGAVLLVTGPVTLWTTRRTEGSRRRRYLRRSLTAVAALAVAPLVVVWVVFPVGLSYIYTHTGRTTATPDLGVPYESVRVTTSDALELAAWYMPSKNGAAVVVFPGASRAKEARMLVGHGYGVLLLEARGQGDSEGDTVRWAGDRDLLAGAAYLQNRPDVDPRRIGGFGVSVGGEILLEGAAQSTGFKAGGSEGAGGR